MSNREPMENHQHPLESNSAHAARTTPVTAPPSLAPAVLQKLGLNGSNTPANVEHLRDALQHKDWFVRAHAVRMLSQLGPLAPLEPLLTALSDEHVSVRVTAVHALANFGTRMPVKRLLNSLLDEEWQVREAVVLALGSLGEQAPREALITASHDTDTVVREAAQQALQQANDNPFIGRENMQETDFQANEYRPSSKEKLPARTPHRSTFWRRVGVSAAVVFVLLNIVAWSAIVQHLRPTHPKSTIVGSGGNQVTPTPSFPTPTPGSISTNKTLYTYTCGGDGIHTLAWSPDGKRLGSTCLDAMSRDATTGNNIFTYGQSSGSMLSLSWSPDGKRIQASGGTVKIWDAATGTLLVEYKPQSKASALVPSTHANPQAQANPQSGGDGVYSSSWSPDGQLIASAVYGNSYGYEVQVWNSQTGTLVYKMQPNANPTSDDYIAHVAWSPNGKYIALTVDGNVQVWSVATKKMVTKYQGDSFAWSPDSKNIVSTVGNVSVQVWNALTGAMIYNYLGHSNTGVSTVAWSPDGKRIASAGRDVQVWDATTGKNAYTYKGNGDDPNTTIFALAWSPDGKYIASGDTNEGRSYIGAVYVWAAA